MKPEEIGKAYDQITDLWQSPDFNMQNGIAQHKRAIAFTKKRGKALDVGCGCTGRIIDLLLDEGFSPEGIDVSTEMLKLAKKRHPSIKFYHQDICNWEAQEKYDFISAWDSIWHVPLELQEQTLTKLVGCLSTNGVLIFSGGGTVEKAYHIDDYMGPEVYYSSLGVNGFVNLIQKLASSLKHFEYDQYPELHTYYIIQKN